jgi:hypothetical protein
MTTYGSTKNEYWVCYDCYAYEANGADSLDWITDPAERTEREQQITSGEILSTQTVRTDKHGRPAQKHPWTPGRFHNENTCGDSHGDYEDHDAMTECETQDFSTSPCGNCDSNLGGSRHAFTYHGQLV